ncbi:MAG: hypothetical protein ACTS27_09380 [Phycisphaerales bacterium]
MWRDRDIVQACADALRDRAAASDAEQSPYGLDALSELKLHAVLRQRLALAGFGVHAEVRLPRRASLPRRSEGERCDIVLTERAGAPLADPHDADTLFADRGVPHDEAFWIEVKCAHQFALVEGVATPSRAYTSQLLRAAVGDLRKLASQRLPFAALLLVMFGAEEAVLRHDLTVWAHRCLDHDLPIGAPTSSGFTTTDRIGNTCCLVSLTRVSPIEE